MKITLKSYIPAELTVYKPESCDLRIKTEMITLLREMVISDTYSQKRER